MVCPCKDCKPPDRYPGCHSHCDDYKSWKDEDSQIKQALKEVVRPGESRHWYKKDGHWRTRDTNSRRKR